jgi:hypothetical protein
MKKLVLVLAGIYLSGAWAATESMSASTPENTSSMAAPIPGEHTSYDSKIKQVLGDKKFEEDKKISDLELRANAGSLNRYSLQFFLGYTGAPVNDLGDPDRPNPSNLPGDYRTYMSGNASLRYRLDRKSGINFGTGMSFYEPLQALTGQEQTRPRSDAKNYGVNNPSISIDRTYGVGATQMSSKVSVAEVTDAGYKASGEWASAGYTQYVKWVPFQTRFILGFKTSLDYYAYARDYLAYKDPQHKGDGNSSNYYVTLIPSVEYKLTDKVNFNTSLGYSYYQARKDNSWSHPLTTWRVGAGWAIARDIYINPYINFFAESPALDTTNFAFNTTFSIF